MKKKNNKNRKKIFNKVDYVEKQPFFSDKEIIFRSRGRAKVITITSRAQIIFFCLLALVGAWGYQSNNLNNKSDKIIISKNIELDQTRNAYIELMSDFVNLHKNMSLIVAKSGKNSKALDKFKLQATDVQDKIKSFSEEANWITLEKISEKISLSEALLQRDLAKSERDEFRRQMAELETVIEEIKVAELEVLQKVETIAEKEVKKIKSAFGSINVSIKKKGLYFNPLANSNKRKAVGGPFVPDDMPKVKDKKINDKISKIFNSVEELKYYKKVAQYVPIGKPVWSYWVTSHYGTRSDPFNGRRARHKGVDLASRTGNKIKTMANGKITRAEPAGGYGNLIVIDHGNGFVTKYAHLNKIYVKKGQYVNKDDTVGEVGTTGRSTGPHLHYEVLYKGHDVNPMTFIKAKLS